MFTRARNTFAATTAAALSTGGLLFARAAGAQSSMLGLEHAQGIGLTMADPRDIVAGIIRTFISLLGILLVSQIMWGGFLMMTHGGNEDRHAKAVGTLKGAVIGFILMMSAGSIVRFVIDALYKATGAMA